MGNAAVAKTIRSPIVSGFKANVVRATIKLYILWVALTVYRNPLVALRVLRELIDQRRRVQGTQLVRKYAKSDGRYHWSNIIPGFPSKQFRSFIKNELNRARRFRDDNCHLNTMIFSITAKCPLRCEHCFDLENLASVEHLSLDELKEIQKKFQDRGIDQIQLSGGEPISRFKDTIALLKSADTGTEFWLLTSGYGLTLEKAGELKDAGLAGVNISLDHWDAGKHNAFRNSDRSYHWVEQAAINSRTADLVVCLSLCATREFVTHENLWKYMNLAKELGAGFVRILEPRSVGGFAGKSVGLDDDQLAILKDFNVVANSSREYRDMPIVMYPGYHQRVLGCFGAGDRYLYVDSRGDIHACPFCHDKVGNALTDSIDDVVADLRQIGCHKFQMVVGG